MVEDIWKDVTGYKGLYQASNRGEIRSLDKYVTRKNGRNYFQKGRILKPYKDRRGYIHVCLHKDGKQKRYGVYILVLMAFDRLPKPGEECNHKDGIKFHNYISNLEWCTHKQNCIHRNRTLKKQIGENNPAAILTNKKVLKIKDLLKQGIVSRQIAEMYKVGRTTINSIKLGKTWKHIKD